MKKFLNEFKTFAIRGNMLDMAIGIIVGGAFTALVTSIVTNIAMPLIGVLIGIDLTAIEITLPRLYGDIDEPNILAVGLFLDNLLTFIIVAFTVFMFVRTVNKFRNKQEETADAPPEPTVDQQLLTEIRDILQDKKFER